MILFEARASIIIYDILTSLRPVGKFLLPANICPIVPSIFLKARVDFEFIDIDLDTLCMDEDSLLQAINKNKDISGVVFVKTFGTTYNAEPLYTKIKDVNQDIFIIDDCCLQKPNFEYDINNSACDLALFSTGYSKYVDIGWGGFGFMKKKYLYKKKSLKYSSLDFEQFTKAMQDSINNLSKIKYYDSNWLGSNEIRFKTFASYKEHVLLMKKRMDLHKELINKIYKDNLPREIVLNDSFQSWRFSIKVSNKDEIVNSIFKSGLFASSHYMDIQFLFKDNYNLYTNSKKIHSQIINLFNDFRFDEEKAIEITKIINKELK